MNGSEKRTSKTMPLVLSVVAGVISVGVFTMMLRSSKGANPVVEQHSRPVLEDGVVTFPPVFAEREKLTFQPATLEPLSPRISVTGAIAWDQRKVATVGARIQGRLRAIFKVEGENVKAGEIIAELESVELGRAQAEVLKARAKEQVAQLDAERERKLADAKISPERDAQFAAANAEGLSAERVAAEKALEALGGVVGGEVGVLRLRSPLDGHMVKLDRKRGETVGPTDSICTVADVSHVWAELWVFERDLGMVNAGDEVDITLPSDRAHHYKGKITHISEVIDEERRAASVRVELENDDRRLRPGLSVAGTINASGAPGERLSVAKTAVTRVDGKETVFVLIGENAVETRHVKLGLEDSDRVEVVSGLKPGERVATSGVFALKAELFR